MSLRGKYRSPEAGFTLVEVMVALAILATALVVLISVTAADVREAQRAQMLNVATNLARHKMYDLEADLLDPDKGFQDTDQELDGTFEEEGWKQIRWKANIRLVELPNLSNVPGLGGDAEQGAGQDASANPLSGMLSSFGLAGQADGSEAAGAGLIQSQFTLIQEVLKQSIRKVTLTVEWEVAGWSEKMEVDCYFTEPAAIARVIGGGGAAGGAAGGADDGGSSGSSTAPSGSGSKSTSGTSATPRTGRPRGGIR